MLNSKHHSFLKRRIALEASLNKLLYLNSAPAGELCSHAINRWCRGQSVMPLQMFVKSLLWTFRQALKKSVIKDNRYLYLKPNNDERTNRFYQSLLAVADDSVSLFITINHFYRQFPLNIILKWIFGLPSSIFLLYKIIKASKKDVQEFSKHSLQPIYLVYAVQTLRFLIASHVLRQSKVTSILVDLDRSTFVSPIILAARALNICSATLVHGAVFPPYLYVPVIADKIFCWGNLHRDLFQAYTQRKVEYIIAGSPVPSQPNVPKLIGKQIQVTFVSQNFSDGAQYDAIDRLALIINSLRDDNIQLAVKAHPADDKHRLAQFCRKRNIPLLPNELLMKECFAMTNIFIVINSTFVFDAVGAGIPVIFFVNDPAQNDMAKLFQRDANALVANTESELLYILTDEQNIIKNYNYDNLKDFYDSYIIRSGNDAAQVIVKEMSKQ